MEIRNIRKQFTIKALIGFSFAIIPISCLASGFYIPYYSVSDLGNARAGGSAIADDASTNYSNPAGLVRLDHQQLVIAGTGVLVNSSFRGTAGSQGLVSPYSETGLATSHTSGVIPALHSALPLSNKFVFGISLTAPYGLGSDYSDTSITRYNFISGKAFSVDIGPSLAYKVNDQLSIGAGPDILYFKLHQKTAAYLYPYADADGLSTTDASGWGYGWHGGLLYQFTPKTRVGINYHSQIVVPLKGESQFYVNQGVVIPSGVITANNTQTNLPLPPISTLSAYHDINNQWAIMGTIEYSQWDVLRNQHGYNIAGPTGVVPTANVPRDWHNTWRFALGTNYEFTTKWLLRLGAAYEQTPINSNTRDMLVPDANHIDLGIGARYQVTPKLKLDAGYNYIISQSAHVNYVSPTAGGSTLNGTSKADTNVFGLQATWDIA